MLRALCRKIFLTQFNRDSRSEAISGRKKASPAFRSLRHEPLEQRALLSVGDVTQISAELPYYSSDWYEPHVSDDGRYVAFTSRASLMSEDTNTLPDVYVVDLQTDDLQWASIPSDGSQPDEGSWKPEISPDGRYVAFMSRAGNLLPADQDPSIDLFVYDRVGGGLECITAGVDGDALSARFSGDNQKIVYEFEFNDAEPSNPNAPTKDIVLYDRTTDERRIVSEGYDGESCNGICWRPQVSHDGGTVVFQSRSSNLVPNDSATTWDVFLYDVSADTLECISTGTDGELGNGESTNIHASTAGRFVTFQSKATNLGAPNSNGNENIYVFDRVTDDLQVIAGDGTPDGATTAIRPDISRDGRYVSYNTTTPGLPEAASSNVADVYVYDRLTDTTQCVSVQADGSPTGAVSAYGSISGSGNVITFLSDATTLTAGPAPALMDVFVMGNPLVQSAPENADFGDAPDVAVGAASGDYHTRFADNGPSHKIVAGLWMGASVDADDGSLQNGAANADDVDQALPDDEDGLNHPIADLTLTIGAQPTVNVIVTNTTGSGAILSGWIDYNSDGVFDNGTERAQVAVVDGTACGIVTLTFPQILTGYTGKTYARFRLSTDAAASEPIGGAWDGEIEDYVATITGPGIGVATSAKAIGHLAGGGPSLAKSDFFGSSVAMLGDLDGDGVTDMAVGAWGDDTGQTNLGNNVGAVHVLFMNSDGTVKGTQKIASGTGGGPNLVGFQAFGYSVCSLGDLDRDGVPDMAVGAIDDDTGGETRGAVHVLMMNSDGTVKTSHKIASDTVGGPTLVDWGRFGGSITAMGDLDGDGITDLAVGAYTDSGVGPGQGAVYVLFMDIDGTVKSSQRIASGMGGGPTLADGDCFGRSVSSLGDLDGDGITDMAVGAYDDATGGTYSGAVYVLFMNADGTVRNSQKIASGIGGGPTLAAGDRFGVSASSLGDLDGDGITDVVVGAYDDSTGAIHAGAIHVLLMNADGTVKSSTKIASDVGGGPALALGDSFGTSVSSLGDLNGDGAIDLAVGAYSADSGGVVNSGVVYVLSLTNAFDFGDAPLPYATTLADDGARHQNTGPMLGASRDGEPGGQPTLLADGDDMNGTPNDEDGVSVAPLLAPGIKSTAVEVHASAPSFLNAWIDYNANGIWESAEQIAVDHALDAGANQLALDVPLSALPGFTCARFRLTSCDTNGSLQPYGEADDGEVEDYAWAIENDIYLYGSAAADVISVWPGAPASVFHNVVINGSATTYDASIYDAIHIDGLGGKDRITVYGTEQNEAATLQPGSVDVIGQTYEIHGVNVETIAVSAGSGDDSVSMTGPTGSNRLYSYANYARLADSARSASYRVDGFDSVSVDVHGAGRNYAYLYDSPGDDLLDAKPNEVAFHRSVGTAEATTTTVSGFQRIYAYAKQGGSDEATLTGSELTRNRFYGYVDYGILTESRRSFYFYARGFDAVTANSPGDGYTYAYLHDSSGADELVASPTTATMDRAAPWSDVTANGFRRVYAYSTRGGEDTAELTGSATGGNYYRGTPAYSTLTDRARSFYHYTRGFDSVVAIGAEADGASDRAYLYDSSGNDTYDKAFVDEDGKYQGGSMTDANGSYANWVKFFDLVYARSSDRDTEDKINIADEDQLAYNLIRSGTW